MIKRHRVAECIKNESQLYAAYEIHSSFNERYRFKVKGWKKVFHSNGNTKRAEVAILISDK